MKRRKLKRKMRQGITATMTGIPAQDSFGGSLGFGGSDNNSSFSSIIFGPTLPTTSAIWEINMINGSSIVTTAEFKSGVAALQTQLDENFTPAWALGAKLNIITQSQLDKTKPTVYVLDYTNDPGDLGYHDITVSEVPVGFVFAVTAKQYGDSWNNTASHEIMEMLVDPYCNLAAEGQYVGSPAFFAYECCDGVEGDGGYSINGFQVSNFVFPAWFVAQTSQQYDYLKTLDAPFTITNGSLNYFRAVGDWQEVDAGAGLLPSGGLGFTSGYQKAHHKYSRKYKRRKLSNPNYGLDHRHPQYIPHPHTHDKRM